VAEPPAPKDPVSLTPRELEILVLIADGLSTKQIAYRLGISFKTVVSHRSRMFRKLNVKNAVGLLRYAIQQKLIKP
jgi:DNA-binding CsgD family transcriptional regulator